MRRGMIGGACLLAFLWATPAAAHFHIDEPASRGGTLFPAPCGDVAPGEPTVFVPGETITVRWTQEVSHYGFYYVRFSPNDDVGFEEYELGMFDDELETLEYAVEVTLPECSCEGCTLQVWQTPADLSGGYFECADIALRPLDPLDVPACPMAEAPPPGGSTGEPTDGGSDDTTGGTPDPDPDPTSPSAFDSSGGDPEAATGDGGAGSSDEGGGCRIGAGPAPAAWLLFGIILGVWRRRRL